MTNMEVLREQRKKSEKKQGKNHRNQKNQNKNRQPELERITKRRERKLCGPEECFVSSATNVTRIRNERTTVKKNTLLCEQQAHFYACSFSSLCHVAF